MTAGKDHTFVDRNEQSPGREADPSNRLPAVDLNRDAGEAKEDAALVLPAPEIACQPLVPAAGRQSPEAATDQSQVHVPEDLRDLIAGIPITPEEAQAFKQSRQLNHVIHRMLTVGLVISTSVMMTGLVLDAILHRDVPSAVPGYKEVMLRVMSLRPSGFLALGLLVLIATPILRVLGSFCEFVYERDWRYAGITFLVILVLSTSLFFGRA